MKPLFDNECMSSILLWMDHQILAKGEAFTNVTAPFYNTSSMVNGLYAYSLPFIQPIADSSISGANIPSGIYLSGSFVLPGQSGFSGINYERGQAYFSNPVVASNISGNVAIKDFNVLLTSEPEEFLIFEKKYSVRPKFRDIRTGVADHEVSIPAIFIRKNGSQNTPFAFGGMDNTLINISATILTDSQFLMDAVTSILRDSVYTRIPLIHSGEMPFDALGRPISGYYNYTTLTSGKLANDDYVFINSSQEISFNRVLRTEALQLNTQMYFGVVDMIIEKPRFPRQ